MVKSEIVPLLILPFILSNLLVAPIFGQIFPPIRQSNVTEGGSTSSHVSHPTNALAHSKPPKTTVYHKPSSQNVKIISPTKGQQVLVGKGLSISGTSAGNTNPIAINCRVSVIVNGIKPYQEATPTGPKGSGDYSTWNFTLTSKYTSIKQGENKITSKYSCANSPALLSHSSVNVTGVSNITNQNVIASSAGPGQLQIGLKLRYAHFLPIFSSSPGSKEHQVKIVVNYTVPNHNKPNLNKTINAEMKVYAINGSLIKTSSFANGFTVKSSGVEQLATSIKDHRIHQLTAVARFVTKDKSSPLSGPIMVKLSFGQKIS